MAVNGLQNPACVCCCRCRWATARVQATWSLTFDCTDTDACGAGMDLVYSITASGTIDETLNLSPLTGAQNGCGGDLSVSPVTIGSGTITGTFGGTCTDNSGTATAQLNTLHYDWNCNTRTGDLTFTITVIPDTSGSVPSVQAADVVLPFEPGQNPIEGSWDEADIQASGGCSIPDGLLSISVQSITYTFI